MGIFEFVFAAAGIALLGVGVVLAATKKGRLLVSAMFSSFFTQANKNPKIVAEYFDKKIEELQKSYEKADNAYRRAAGEKLQNDKRIAELEKQLGKLNKSIINAKEHENISDARMYANEAMAIKAELDAKKENIPVFEDAMKSAGDLRERAQAAIQELKARKKSDIAKAEAGKAAQEIYSQFDESRVSSDIDRVLDQFSDYANDQEKMGIGAKASWDSSYESQRISAEKRSRAAQSDDYIDELLQSLKTEQH